jgi:drug/metabolite transporter (DMT)-like permease
MLAGAMEAPRRGAIISVAAGLGFAATMTFARVHFKWMTATERTASIAFWFVAVGAVIGLATWPFGWVETPSPAAAPLAGAGISGGLGHIAAPEAIARAPVSVLAPFKFIGLIWALDFDVLPFDAAPGPWGLVGVAAIAAAALIVTFGGVRR